MFKNDLTILQVDDNDDDIFLTHHEVSSSGLPGKFVFQTHPENIFGTLDELVASGTAIASIIVLLDISMPRCNGFETLGKIRKHPAYQELCVLMLSSSHSDDDKLESFSARCDGYLVKPFKLEDLYRAIPSVPYAQKRLPLNA